MEDMPATQDDDQVVPAQGVGESSAHGEVPSPDTSTIQSDGDGDLASEPEGPPQVATTVLMGGPPNPPASDVDSFSSLMDDWEEVQSLARTSSTIVVDFHEASDVDTGPS